MKKYIFAFAAVAAIFVSCSQDAGLVIVENAAKAEAITSVSASSESGTRAVVDGTSIKWQTGDKLGVLGTNASSEVKNTAYTLSSGAGTTTGSFTNSTSDITAISAIMYPYQKDASWDADNSTLTLEIPYLQKGVKGSFDPKSAIMYAIGSSTDQALTLAVNFLKVTISETETNIHSITISSTAALSGKMKVTGSGIAAATEGTLNSVTLTAGANKCFEAGDYYIAVKAGDIESPSVSYVYYNTTDHTATEKTKAGSGTLAFDGKNVRTITADFTKGTVTERNAVQLWENGPYFAEYNVGVTDGKATSYGGYYCWGSSIDKDSHAAYKRDDDALTGDNDTATKLWGSNWRMPTYVELQALLDHCNAGWTTVNGVNGINFTSKDAYSSSGVFLPAAGYCEDGDVYNQGDFGIYWSSTPVHNHDAVCLYFNLNDLPVDVKLCTRYFGCSVRAVLAEE